MAVNIHKGRVLPSQLSNNEQSLAEKSAMTTLRSSLFAQLFEADKNRLYAYIFAYVADSAAADDIFQETSLTLWREFEKFEPDTSFSKWANGIAFNRIRVYRRSQQKYTLGLSDDFLKEFSETIAIVESRIEPQSYKWQHLQHCSGLLTPALQKIYQAFYVNNLKAKDVAEDTGRSITAIRKSVHKLRKKLFDCVEHKVREGGL